MNAGPGLRSGRTAMFALVCLALAVGAHEFMSGVRAPLWSTAAAFEGLLGVGWLASRRQRWPVTVTGLTVGAQAVSHLCSAFRRAR